MIATLLGLSFIGSCAAWPLGRRIERGGVGWVLALLPAGLFAAFLRLAPTIEAGHVVGEHLAWVPSLGVTLAWRLDGFSYLFCLLISGIGTLVVIYAGAYLREKSASDRARFLTLILLFMTAMLAAVLADNLIVLFVFWEATSLLSFLLIGFDTDSPSGRRAALMSLRVTAGGGLALLAAFLLIGAVLGTYTMSEVVTRGPALAQSPWIGPIILGLLIGAFTKSAQFPFHFWLPNAMQAPTPASAYLHSATMVKLGVYLLARFELVIAAVPGGRDILLVVALATMIVGAMQALRAENFKSVLAYSTIASLGILVMLVGLDGPMASVATVGFIFAHALYKAALFFCAGTVLHATGLTKLRSMRGLVRYLPMTALAAALASLSMAGLPPFLGFVSKEFLFEAQIRSSWDAIPMAVAVLTNAVLVGAAGVITLRPFFFGRGTAPPVKHREVPAMLVGPLVLALLGLVISLQPDWVSRTILRPAVVAIYGEAVDVKMGVWHGITPMLGLSAAVVAIGVLLFTYWVRLHQWLRTHWLLSRYDTEHVYDALLRGIHRVAARVAAALQRGDLRDHQSIVLAAVAAIAIGGVVATPALVRVNADWGTLRIAPAVVALVGLIGGIAAVRARSLLVAMIGVGLAGLTAALTFMLNGAPDLALTQFAVESLVVVLLTAALLPLPLAVSSSRTRRIRWRDALLATVLSLLLFAALLDMSAAPPRPELSHYFGDNSFLKGFGRNVVNVILVDFRGFDTLGETTVIALSGIIAWSLLGPRSARRIRVVPPPGQSVFIFWITSGIFFWILLALSVAILLRGHNAIGGGFVGGLTAALAFGVISLAHGTERARALLRIHPIVLAGAGLLFAVASGVPGLVTSGEFLRHVWVDATLFGIHVKQGTTLVFDLGVYLVVTGSVLAFLFGLQRETAR